MKNIFYFFAVLLLVGCTDDPVAAGIETPISGRIFDTTNNVPLGGQKVVVREYKKKFVADGGTIYDLIASIDSTYTNEDGFYNLKFKTTGNGHSYKVHFEAGEYAYGYDFAEIEKLGEAGVFNLSGLQLYPMTLKVTLNNLSTVPVEIFPGVKRYGFAPLTQNNAENSVLVPVDKNGTTTIDFARTTATGEREFYSVILPATNTSGLTETSITINDSDFGI